MSMDVKPWIALVCWPRAVENLSAGRAKKARKAMEWPSSTRSRGCSVRGTTGASVADTDGASVGDTAMSSRVWVVDGIGAGLVGSLTGASLVAMMDNFTPGPGGEDGDPVPGDESRTVRGHDAGGGEHAGGGHPARRRSRGAGRNAGVVCGRDACRSRASGTGHRGWRHTPPRRVRRHGDRNLHGHPPGPHAGHPRNRD